MNVAQPLTRTFAALADPTRLAILERLRLGEATATELAKPFQLTQPTISKHLRVLEEAGLISRGRDAQRRPCRINPASLHQAVQWLGTFQQFWDESFHRLDQFLADETELATEVAATKDRRSHE